MIPALRKPDPVSHEKHDASDRVKKAHPLLFLALFFAVIGCDGFFPSQQKETVPSDHTIDIQGVFHKPGLNDPLDEDSGCGSIHCHGSELKGGVAEMNGKATVVPSCYQCHGPFWEGDGGDGGEDD